MAIGQRKLGRNQITWLIDGPGGHGDEPLPPESVAQSLSGRFRFVAGSDGTPGFRPPQLGALHAVLAARTTEAEDAVTVVMPTGTGKTETMLALFAHDPGRTLIIVPSDALRAQIAAKFQTLGILPEAGAVTGAFKTPVVGLLKSGLKTVAECDALVGPSNVVVATPQSISQSSVEARARLIELCDQLVVDEAHHVAARTWRAIAEEFAARPVTQFTATPFREDGEYMGGRIRYAYPLRLAQRDGYFAPINYRAITDLGGVDRTLAEAAVAQLHEDVAAGRDHILMARVQTIPRAEEILAIYEEVAPELTPVRIDSKMSKTRQREALALLDDRTSRAIVCVDMLGEGFDLPSLKIAAIHDPHKSLAVTLQFVGRFARVGGEELGDASVFVPRLAGDVDDRLRRLYGEDSDWNALIRDLTEAEVAQEEERSEFESGFGALPTEVALRSVQPKMSTVVYRSAGLQWNPEAVYQVFPDDQLLTKTVAVNAQQHVLWFITAEETPVPWGEFTTFREVVHHLYVVHCDLDSGLMYINSSYNDSVHDALAKTVGGDGVELIKGDVAYRVLGRVQRRVPTNIGLLDAVNRNRRFSMHVGADVLAGFGPGAAQKSKTNIYAHGYMDGVRVSFGASRKGRVWSHRVAPDLLRWVNWARSVGAALTDETISVDSVMDGFIIPTAATSRPDLVPLGVEWSYSLVGTVSEARRLTFQGVDVPLIDAELAITAYEAEGPIRFEARSDSWSVEYEMSFGENGPVVSAVGEDATIALPKTTIPLSEFMTKEGLTVFFEQEALLSPDGYIIQPDRTRPRYEPQQLEVIDWGGVNIQNEVQGAQRDATSIQFRVIETVNAEADWDVVIDDHGSGEAADVVFLRRDEHRLEIVMAHCKASSAAAPGARVGDLYELCGQAAKSHKARSEVELVLRRILRRERKRQLAGDTGLVVGDAGDLVSLLHSARLFDTDVTVLLAQPGLSRAAMSQSQAELLACTELYLSETYASRFRVLCSA